eukprot:9227134-Pyramimonas_sp.AAC.1
MFWALAEIKAHTPSGEAADSNSGPFATAGSWVLQKRTARIVSSGPFLNGASPLLTPFRQRNASTSAPTSEPRLADLAS